MTNTFPSRIGLAILLGAVLTPGLVGCFGQQATAAEPSSETKPSGRPPSLDQRLNDELDRELLGDLPAPPQGAGQASGTSKPNGQRPKAGSDLDRQLLDQLGDGEDIGQPAADPLVSLSRRMRTVEQRISQQDTAEATQRLQLQIVTDLEQLIEQAKKQCSGGSSKKGGAPKPGGKPGSSKKGGTGDNATTSKSAKDSVETPERTGSTEAELEAMKALIKDVWGHLPPKLREQLQSPAAEQFLPKYEQVIEAYYRRLAEERSE
jgi:hypothetical protein